MKSLLTALKTGRVLVSDGAWGTQLHKRGLQAGECPELWNITHRADVFAVAQGYIDARADMILTNSFGGNPSKLAHYGLESRTAELNEAAAGISREAAAAGGDRLVLGSMGPTGVVLMMGEVAEEVIYEGFCTQARALAAGGVHALCIETMSAIDEACLAIRAAKASTRLEIVCTFTFEKGVSGDYRTMMGVSPADMVLAVRDAGADIIGANCGNGIDGMVEVVRAIRNVDASTPVLVHANAGKPVFEGGATVFPETPEMMAAKVGDLIAAGANIIGGCCGTTPEHIRAIADPYQSALKVLPLSQTEGENGVVEIGFDRLQFSIGLADIRRALGYGDNLMDNHFEEILTAVMAHLPQRCTVRGGYVIRDSSPENGRSDGLSVGGCFFTTGKIIARQLDKVEKVALFICSIGPGMEDWSREMFREGDGVTGHFIDTAASMVVEAAAGMLHDHIGDIMARQGLRITNRFSPGYCGWQVSEQNRLFSFFPAGFCGVTLTDSALMLPVKSVSGIIGIGARVNRQPYVCNQCKRNNCTYRASQPAQQRKGGAA